MVRWATKFLGMGLGVLGFTGMVWAGPSLPLVTDVRTDPAAKEEVPIEPSSPDFKGLFGLSTSGPVELVDMGATVTDAVFQSAHKHLAVSREVRRQKWGSLMLNVQSSFQTAQIVIPSEGTDFKSCIENQGTLAFVMLGEPVIYVCRGALTGDYDRLGMGQILAHEAAHVYGIADECEATSVEITAMRESRYGLQFKNGYYEKCGFGKQRQDVGADLD